MGCGARHIVGFSTFLLSNALQMLMMLFMLLVMFHNAAHKRGKTASIHGTVDNGRKTIVGIHLASGAQRLGFSVTGHVSSPLFTREFTSDDRART